MDVIKFYVTELLKIFEMISPIANRIRNKNLDVMLELFHSNAES
jgi:hypothetical protein